MKKVALFAFRGDPMCFAHVLLYALDLHARETEVRIILEGEATATAAELAQPGKPFANQYANVRDAGLIECACKACSMKTGAADRLASQKIPLVDEMNGHPSLAKYMEDGWQVLVF